MAYYVAVGIGAYAALSLALFCFPNVLHKRKKYKSEVLEEALNSPSHKVLLIAHRGGARERFENTMSAFEHAVAKGAHALEFDLHLTKDNRVVVSHDENLQRLCHKPLNIRDLNYDELPPFASEIELHFSDKPYINNEPDLKFPLLEDVFQRFPQTIMHFDLKGDTPGLIEETAKIVKSYKRESTSVWGAVNGKKIDKLRKLNPDVMTFCSAGGYLGVYLLYIFGLLPFVPLKFHFFSVAKYTVDFDRMGKDKTKPLPFIFKVFACILKCFDFLSKPLFRHLQNRGIIVTLWVLNDPFDYKQAIDREVNGIMTDLPEQLRDYLDAKNKYLQFPNNNSRLLGPTESPKYT